ncbi:hypothetical protein [uncultured Tateyamaria sp.]|uniref:hypothetical protein n=1 Tax=Tateyamaria sp. 1078 TaxID=3417464 RepID=UPI002633CA6E|nr:hypothetical protein [uncultured Tateyamaria sp.]
MSFLSFFHKPALTDLLSCLGAEHPGSDQPERFQFDLSHGVQSWYDTEHTARSGFGTLTASRAITMSGVLFWRVCDPNRGLVYQAQAEDPNTAMDMALRAWDAARQLRDAPAALHRLIAELRRGHVDFRVELSDALATPLSIFGFRALLDASGLSDLSRISAQSLLRLIKSEPLVMHVMHAAWARQQAAPAPDEPVGYEAMC